MTAALPSDSRHYRRIEQALRFLTEHHRRQPSLAEAAARAGMSEYHFQRLFSQWAGISPKRFLQFLSKEYIKARLAQRASPLDAALEAGLSGPGRLHELFVSTEAITPAQYRRLGRGLEIRHGFHDSPFGEVLLGVTAKGICHLAFTDGDRQAALADLREEWSLASLVEDQPLGRQWGKRVFAHAGREDLPLHLLLRGTNFQIKVWEALLRLPSGEVCAYEAVAAAAGRPAAVRAAASAVAANRIALLIPCHRVVRKLGDSGQYRWGPWRKRLVLAHEGACRAGEFDEAGAWHESS